MTDKKYSEEDDLETLLDAYKERFDDTFPTFILGNYEEPIKKAICECLKTGKSYEYDLPDGAVA